MQFPSAVVTKVNMEIKLLLPEDAELIELLLNTSLEQDRRWFHPFEFRVEAIRPLLQAARKDKFYGLFSESGSLMAFHMLRGLDDGYLSPMYGIYVAPMHRNAGIGGLSVCHGICVSRLAGCPSLLLKVYQENITAVRLYARSGFSEVQRVGNVLTMEKRFRLR